jgi:tetratricopeptide (TPR) repeat protein
MTFTFPRAARFLALQILALGLITFASCKRRVPEDEKAVRAELRQALSDRAFPRAVELAQKIVAVAPRENGAWERLARARLGLGDLEGARETLTLWRANVRKPSAKYAEYTGDIAASDGNDFGAIAAWAKVAAAQPENVRVLRKLARAYRRQSNWQDEDASLSKMLALEESAATRVARALCRRRMHRWADAQEDFRQAQALAPEDAEVRHAAELFGRLGKFMAEIREFDARLALAPKDDQLLTDRALLFLRSEDPELALEDARAAAAMAPWAMRPRLFQAIAALALNRIGDAEKLGIDPRLTLSALTPEFLATISRADSEISVERNNAELYITRAWQLNDIGQPRLALEDAETAQRLDGKLAGAFAEASYALAKLGRSDEAFEQIKRATEIDANYSTAWQYRGELEMIRGDHAAAIESLTRSLAISQTAAALQKREECYIKVGLLAKAEEDHRALEALNASAFPADSEQ